jgi:hypothetical protein
LGKLNIEKTSNAVEDILRYHKDVIVSVREIYNTLINDYNYVGLEESELSAVILNDPRFEYLEMPDYFEKFSNAEKVVFNEQKSFIEKMGFYSGPRVKLASIEIEYEKIIEIISRKVDAMMDILIALWDKRPSNDDHTEDQLLEILAKAQKMQREIKSLTENDQIADIIHFLRGTSDFS